MVYETESRPKAFVKVFWEIRFFPILENRPDPENMTENPLLPLKDRVQLFIPTDMLQNVNAQHLLKLMNVFHATSKQLMDDLLNQAKGLEEFTEADAEKNFEIAKMISWIKMLQELINRLKKDIL